MATQKLMALWFSSSHKTLVLIDPSVKYRPFRPVALSEPQWPGRQLQDKNWRA